MRQQQTLFSITMIALLLLIMTSCAGSGNAVTPVTEPEVIIGTLSRGSNSQTHLWGYYYVFIDIENQTVEAVPNRQAMFTANVVNFINSNPANLGFTIEELYVGSIYVIVGIDVSITHPFPGMPQYNGYDVRGVFMGDGAGTMYYSSDLDYSVLGTDQFMLPDPDDGFGAPDGYTRWFNKPEFSTGGIPLFQYTQGKVATPGFNGTATLNAYKYFADGLGVKQDLWEFLTATTDDGVFSAGATNTRNYYLRFPHAKEMEFGYAIVANWKAPDVHPSNATEAVACSVIDNSNVYYIDPTHNGGNLILDISLFGWEYQPSTIYIESTVLSAVASFNPSVIVTGSGDHYSTYHVEIPADNVSGIENQEFWVIAEYEGFDYSNPSGVPNLAESDPLAVFFRHDLSVEITDDFGWARTWGGSYSDWSYDITADGSGSVYVTGHFRTTVDFDPGGGDPHTTNGSSDVFLSKFDSSGNFEWARTWGGSDYDGGLGLADDGLGNVYVTGMFSDTVDFDPGPGTDEHISNGNYDVFLSKFDSSGDFEWARTWGGSSRDEGLGLAADGSGRVYVAGGFYGTVDFDPGPGTDEHTSNGNYDVFLSKFDSSGDFQWARTWGGPVTDWGYGIAADGSGNVYVTGDFEGTVDFNPGGGDSHTSNGNNDAFLSKFDLSGNFAWARTWGGPKWDISSGVTVDDLGNVYVTGHFWGTVDFNPGGGDPHTSNGYSDVFLSKFDSSGNYGWARIWGGSGIDHGSGVATDGSGSVYVTGHFWGTVDFNPGGGDPHTSNGWEDVFLSKFDSSGDFKWARTWGGSHDLEMGLGVAVDGSGNVYATGWFRGTVDFAPTDPPCNEDPDEHTSNGLRDAFLTKHLPDGCW